MSFMRAAVRRAAVMPQWQQSLTARRWATEDAQAKEEAKEKTEETTEAPEADHPGELECPKEKKIHELTKQVAYSLAEADNARKIALKDVENARQFALKSFAKDLLDVVDNLERAISSLKPEQLENEHVAVLHKGVSMTQHNLIRVLEKNGVTKQDVKLGDQFDPNLHEALFNMPNNDTSTPGTVGNIVKSGFDYKNRVLRASQVGVYQEE